MSEVERYRPLPEKRAARGDQPPRVVLLYLDEAGGHMAGWEWIRPKVVFESDFEYETSYDVLASQRTAATYTATISGGEFRGVIKHDPRS